MDDVLATTLWMKILAINCLL